MTDAPTPQLAPDIAASWDTLPPAFQQQFIKAGYQAPNKGDNIQRGTTASQQLDDLNTGRTVALTQPGDTGANKAQAQAGFGMLMKHANDDAECAAIQSQMKANGFSPEDISKAYKDATNSDRIFRREMELPNPMAAPAQGETYDLPLHPAMLAAMEPETIQQVLTETGEDLGTMGVPKTEAPGLVAAWWEAANSLPLAEDVDFEDIERDAKGQITDPEMRKYLDEQGRILQRLSNLDEISKLYDEFMKQAPKRLREMIEVNGLDRSAASFVAIANVQRARNAREK